MPRVCRYCSALITTSHPKVTRCSSPECKRAWKRDYMRQYQRDYVAKNGEWANAKYRERQSNRTCVDCGAPVGHGRGQETRCRRCGKRRCADRRAQSAREQKAAQLAESMSRSARARRALAQAAVGTASTWPFVQGRCHSCGERFVCRVTNSLPKFCSKSCLAREAKARRRALQKGCQVTPGRRYAIYERDDWTCRICGDPVNRAAKVPELDAPVVDHRVPLAAGGPHSPENWQTAHYYCNSVKQDRLDFDFATPEAA